MQGVTIGRNCVIGANSVVTKDIPDGCVAVGVPAKVIKTEKNTRDSTYVKNAHSFQQNKL